MPANSPRHFRGNHPQPVVLAAPPFALLPLGVLAALGGK